MFFVLKTDVQGGKHPTMPTTERFVAEEEYARPLYGRFVEAALMQGDPVIGFVTLAEKAVE